MVPGRLVLVDGLFIVMSGLPGSGKTTLGRQLARQLKLAMLDKDDILDVLLDSLGAAETVDRHRLSRAADAVLQATVLNSPSAVVSSFWRRERLSTTSGTPWDWLPQLPGARLVEVHCVCSPTIAVNRFRSRRRHPGHHDVRRSREQLTVQFERLDAEGPLGIGTLVPVPTTDRPDPSQVIAVIQQRLGGAPAQ